MCLYYSRGITRNLITRFEKNNGVLNLWKVYKKKNNNLVSIFFPEQKSGVIEKDGIYNSSKRSLKHNYRDVNWGFHVCLDRKSAREFIKQRKGCVYNVDASNSCIIIKVRVKIDDLVCGGIWNADVKTAVFRKLEVTKEEWNKIKF
jgi:hypothetical protein